ncbi:MAG: HEPN domain-containing protein [Anaerolineae bacterium]
MKSPREHALRLLGKAEHNLVAARATLSTGQALDMVCFHAQQVAEKSLKALLALYDVEYPWRHDLAELLELVRPLAPGVDTLEGRVIQLMPFAVAVCYDEEFEPSLSEAMEALQTATAVYSLIAQAIQPGESDDTT